MRTRLCGSSLKVRAQAAMVSASELRLCPLPRSPPAPTLSAGSAVGRVLSDNSRVERRVLFAPLIAKVSDMGNVFFKHRIPSSLAWLVFESSECLHYHPPVSCC